MARTLTGNNAQREQRLQSLMLDRIVAKYERRIQKEIVRAMHSAAYKYREGNTLAVDLMLPEHQEKLTKLLNSLWLETGGQFSEHIVRGLKSYKPSEIKQDEIPPTEAANAIMMNWIRSYGASKITQITSTTQNDITSIITTGIADGLSEREIARQISTLSSTLAGSRAQTIARTETHGAANVAAQATAEATGIDMQRQWVAAGGERTRTTHQEANGQIVGMREPFTVGGVSLMFPGDPSANAPAETINCRCAVIFVV